jgi:hypothetical protein
MHWADKKSWNMVPGKPVEQVSRFRLAPKIRRYLIANTFEFESLIIFSAVSGHSTAHRYG